MQRSFFPFGTGVCHLSPAGLHFIWAPISFALVTVMYTNYIITLFNAYVTSSLVFITQHFDINLQLEHKSVNNVKFTAIFTCRGIHWRIKTNVKPLGRTFPRWFCRAWEEKNAIYRTVQILQIHMDAHRPWGYIFVQSPCNCAQHRGLWPDLTKAVSEAYDFISK